MHPAGLARHGLQGKPRSRRAPATAELFDFVQHRNVVLDNGHDLARRRFQGGCGTGRAVALMERKRLLMRLFLLRHVKLVSRSPTGCFERIDHCPLLRLEHRRLGRHPAFCGRCLHHVGRLAMVGDHHVGKIPDRGILGRLQDSLT